MLRADVLVIKQHLFQPKFIVIKRRKAVQGQFPRIAKWLGQATSFNVLRVKRSMCNE